MLFLNPNLPPPFYKFFISQYFFRMHKVILQAHTLLTDVSSQIRLSSILRSVSQLLAFYLALSDSLAKLFISRARGKS